MMLFAAVLPGMCLYSESICPHYLALVFLALLALWLPYLNCLHSSKKRCVDSGGGGAAAGGGVFVEKGGVGGGGGVGANNMFKSRCKACRRQHSSKSECRNTRKHTDPDWNEASESDFDSDGNDADVSCFQCGSGDCEVNNDIVICDGLVPLGMFC